MTGKAVVRGLDEDDLGSDPIAAFRAWFEEARKSGIFLPEAMTLASASADAAPSARMMLLKSVDRDGFVFYTNYASRKGRELTENPRAALVFHWGVLQRQVRVEGRVEKLGGSESEAYFRTRPRGSQLGAWASNQSSVVESREELEAAYERHEREFEGRDVPRPDGWGGFRLVPSRIEFWQGRANRLHDRLLFSREDEGWRVVRLAP